MPSDQMNLQSLSDEVLKRAFILSMAMNAGHPDFVDTAEAGEIIWFDHDAEALFNAVLDEIARRVTERGEPFVIDGFEAIGGNTDEVLIITPEGGQICTNVYKIRQNSPSLERHRHSLCRRLQPSALTGFLWGWPFR